MSDQYIPIFKLSVEIPVMEKIVGIVTFEGKVLIATDRRVYRYTEEYGRSGRLTPVQFEVKK